MTKYRIAQAFAALMAFGLVGAIAWAAWSEGREWAGIACAVGFIALVGVALWTVSTLSNGKPYRD